MISFCKTVHNLLGFPDTHHRCRSIPHRGRDNLSASDGAGLRCVAGELPSLPPHVVESAAVGLKPPLSPPPPLERICEEGSGLGCLYRWSGSAGLELCTESLGFESCCDGRVGAEEKQAEQEIHRRIEECKKRPPGEDDEVVRRRRGRSRRRRTEPKEFPPPLPSLSGRSGARSSCFLKAVKREGRLVLTEVRVERPEIFRASRQDGRLRLDLVKSDPEQAEVEETAEEEAVAEEVTEVAESAVEEPELQKDEQEEEESVELEEAVAEEVLAEVAAAEEEEMEEEVGEEEQQQRWSWWEVPAVLERRREDGELGRARCQEMVRSGLPPSLVTTA